MSAVLLLPPNSAGFTILLANEGINGTICGYRQNIDIFYDFVQNKIGEQVKQVLMVVHD
jgi:predicted sulfurtransferase